MASVRLYPYILVPLILAPGSFCRRACVYVIIKFSSFTSVVPLVLLLWLAGWQLVLLLFFFFFFLGSFTQNFFTDCLRSGSSWFGWLLSDAWLLDSDSSLDLAPMNSMNWPETESAKMVIDERFRYWSRKLYFPSELNASCHRRCLAPWSTDWNWMSLRVEQHIPYSGDSRLDSTVRA